MAGEGLRWYTNPDTGKTGLLWWTPASRNTTTSGLAWSDEDCECCPELVTGCCPEELIASDATPTQGTILQIEITALTGNLADCFTVGATDTMKDNWSGIEQYNKWTTGDTTGHEPTSGFFGSTEWAGVELDCFEDVATAYARLRWREGRAYPGENNCPVVGDGGLGAGGVEWTTVSISCDPLEFVFSSTIEMTDPLICNCPEGSDPPEPADGTITVKVTVKP